MARNEEKQQGKLNRLWLQKETEEGRLKDVHERRPKLSTLNSASSVKKWIPSIKNEIEYYLQQSQLTHYPERKIAEFQLCLEELEREYKRFITKLRVLDPTCKHKPWTPRAYCKRRAETQDSPILIKKTRPCGSQGGGESDSDNTGTGCCKTSDTERHRPLSQPESSLQTPVPTSSFSETSEVVCADQDQPLSFDRTRLAVAAAAFRGPSDQLGCSQTQSLVRVLQLSLPNLSNSQTVSTLRSDAAGARESCDSVGSAVKHKDATLEKSDYEAAERIPGISLCGGTTVEKIGHVLGLDCYSSSEDSDT